MGPWAFRWFVAVKCQKPEFMSCSCPFLDTWCARHKVQQLLTERSRILLIVKGAASGGNLLYSQQQNTGRNKWVFLSISLGFWQNVSVTRQEQHQEGGLDRPRWAELSLRSVPNNTWYEDYSWSSSQFSHKLSHNILQFLLLRENKVMSLRSVCLSADKSCLSLKKKKITQIKTQSSAKEK